MTPRKAVYGPPPTHGPRPTRLGLALLVVLVVLLSGVGLAVVHAQEAEVERYVPASRGTRPAVTRWRPLLAEYDDWDVDVGLRIVDCESGGDPEAVNPYSGATGLWQTLGWSWLARRLFGSGDLTDPWINTAVAHVLWLDSGGTFRWHWGSSRACWS